MFRGRYSSLLGLLLLVVVVVPNDNCQIFARQPLSSSRYVSSINAVTTSLPFPRQHLQHVMYTIKEFRGGGGGENMTLVLENDAATRLDLDIRSTKHQHVKLSYRRPTYTPLSSMGSVSRRRDDQKKDQRNYKDILECRSERWVWPDEVEPQVRQLPCSIDRRGGADWLGDSLDDFEDDLSSHTDSSSYSASSPPPAKHDVKTSSGTLGELGKNTRDNKEKRPHSPVVYRYYGRSRSRGPSSPDAPHFLLLGPNVDHWKSVGQILASRGFNVMACERVVEDDDSASHNHKRRPQKDSREEPHDAPDLVLDLLDLLKWNKAVLVGCDEESILAMESAMILAPDRVCGLILCGDLTDANRLAVEAGGVDVLDTFLHRILDCPFVIVWGGDGSPSVVSGSSARAAVETDDARCVILGGGPAPYRTKPEQFAWVLTRFVEEKLEYHPMHNADGGEGKDNPASPSNPLRQNRGSIIQNLNLPFAIDSLVSPEGRLLLGRAVAAAIFYASVMKVVIVQYGILRAGLISVKTSVDSVEALRRKLFHGVAAFVWNFGYIPRLFKFSLQRTREVDEDYIENRKSDTGDTEGDTVEKNAELPNADADNGGNGQLPAGPGSTSRDTSPEMTNEEPPDQEERSRFKPFFFLDNIIT